MVENSLHFSSRNTFYAPSSLTYSRVHAKLSLQVEVQLVSFVNEINKKRRKNLYGTY